ncbi:MAG TPA: methyltransferase domain-containing protein [Chloroflexota bacterium]|nr:methyltransferase domain-containing protein [Chloroflexota bacterium]
MTVTEVDPAEAQRYTRRSILRSEQMYGRGFQSPNYPGAMEEFCALAGLREERRGVRVLDVGSGLGGAAFYLAERFGAQVTGVDAAAAMVELASERAADAGIEGVTFVHGDVRTLPLERGAFDLVWTRDCILYMPEKGLVWGRLHDALVPGGRLLVTDFCRGGGEPSEAFQAYVRQCGYALQTIREYAATLEGAGFQDVVARDLTARFAETLREERAELLARREQFLAQFEREDLEYLVSRWEKKDAFCRERHLAWGCFTGRRAA